MKRILQNSFGKTILCLLVALMTGGTSWAAVSSTPYKTALFARNNCSQLAAYGNTSSWYATNDGFRVNVENFDNGWWLFASIYYGHIRCFASPASITTAAPIDEPIAKVDLTIDDVPSSGITSIKLYTSVDYENWGDPVGTFTVAKGKQTVELPTPEANLFYKIEVVGTGNYDDLRISKVEYYNEVPDPNAVETPVISGNPELIFDTSTEVTITCEEGATIEYSTDGTTWDVYENPFILKHTATVKARATKEGKNPSQEASKTFSHRDDVHDVTWNLTQTPTGTSSEPAVTWTRTVSNEYFATMTLQKSGSSTNADNFLGGTNNHTRFYQNQTLTIKPLPGYSIVYVEFTCQDNTASGLNGTWTNATASVSGSTVTVTPSDGTASISTTISAETHVTGVKVYYSLSAPPYIEVAEETVNATSASTTNTIGVVYSDELNPANAEVIVGDENHEQVSWLTATLNEDYNLKYTIAPNTTTEVRTAYIAVHVQGVYSHTITVTQEAAIVLANAEDNIQLISDFDGETCSVVLAGRTLSKNNAWNSLCLPFDLTIAGSILDGDGVVAKEIDNASFSANTLTLNFKEVTTLEAGKPYIIKWTSGTNLVNPAFANVTIKSGEPTAVRIPITNLDGSGEMYITFEGTYKKLDNFPDARHILYVGSSNNLNYPGPNSWIGAQRAYFKLEGVHAGSGSGANFIKESVIGINDEDPTGIDNVNVNDNLNLNDEPIYNIAGQRISKMQKGINIVNGKKIFVK